MTAPEPRLDPEVVATHLELTAVIHYSDGRTQRVHYPRLIEGILTTRNSHVLVSGRIVPAVAPEHPTG